MSSLQPILLYGDYMSPNPCKVRILLEELNLPYTDSPKSFVEVKQEPFISVNPNGRVPAIHDPNTGVTLWESAAIMIYLIETYDKSQTLTYTTSPEKYELQQWLAFQISGQGPYYGQYIYFWILHPERVPSVRERFAREMDRVRSVLNTYLTRKAAENNDPDYTKTWLVGDKLTYADLSWVMWEHIADFALSWVGVKLGEGGKYPAYDAWMARLYARPSCVKAIQLRAEGLEKGGLIKLVEKKLKEEEDAKAAEAKD